MIVQDLIRMVSVEDFLAEYKLRENITEERMEESVAFFTNFFEMLLGKKPVESEFIILGHKTYYATENEEYYETAAYKLEELKAFKPIPLLHKISRLSIMRMPKDKKYSFVQKFRLPEAYAYDFTPWDEILGMELDEGNVKDVSPAKMLSDIIYEMTFTGYTEEEVQETIDDINERIRETEEILKLPEKEQAKHFITSEELFSSIGYVDERTEEEKLADEKKYADEMMKNWLYKYDMLEKYFHDNNREEE